MGFTPPKGWAKESDKLFIHDSGVRVSLMTYRGKEGWFLIPADLDQAVLEYAATNEGRDKAFEAFASGVLNTKPKKEKAPEKKKKPKKKIEVPAEEGEGEKEGEPVAKEAAEEGDEDEDEDEEDEEKESEPDVGD